MSGKLNKTFAILFLFLSIGLNLFGQNSTETYGNIYVSPSNIEASLKKLKAGSSYRIYFESGFNLSELNENYRYYGLVSELHRLYSGKSKILLVNSPVLYIYFNGNQTAQSFTEIKKMLQENPDKAVCVDVSESYYRKINDKYAGFPKNCFSSHDNLFWLYLGNMQQMAVSEGMASGCKNLLSVIVWNESGLEDNCFENAKSDLRIYNENGNFYTGDFYKNNWNQIHFGEKWDYSLLTVTEALTLENKTSGKSGTEVLDTESETYDSISKIGKSAEKPGAIKNYINQKRSTGSKKVSQSTSYPPVKACDTGVKWLIDWRGHFQKQQLPSKTDNFGMYDYINSEDYVEKNLDYLSELTVFKTLSENQSENEIDFTLPGNYVEITKTNASSFDTPYAYKSDPFEVAKAFIASYILKSENYKKYIGSSDDAAEPFEVSLDGVNSYGLTDYSKLKVYVYSQFDKTSGDGPVMVGVEGFINEEKIQEFTVLRMKRTGNSWYVINIFNGWRQYYKNQRENP